MIRQGYGGEAFFQRQADQLSRRESSVGAGRVGMHIYHGFQHTRNRNLWELTPSLPKSVLKPGVSVGPGLTQLTLIL